MPAAVVNPTRMELTRLKGKLRTAQRGHKLLKDKRDELMKQFLDVVREVRTLRSQVERDLMRVHSSFTVASALMSGPAMEQALMYPKQSVELSMTFQNVMSVNVPVYHFQTRTADNGDIYPYGFAATSGALFLGRVSAAISTSLFLTYCSISSTCITSHEPTLVPFNEAFISNNAVITKPLFLKSA